MAGLRDVDLNLLLLFQHLLEDRNISSVARRLDLSQPAVSNACAACGRRSATSCSCAPPRACSPRARAGSR